ncbi:MAG: hypothetical protein M8357_01625 [Desulfobulbaceae bacterium]|nr:hypothetical protein [Desulfobulbaceae bacterium]
MKKRLIKTTVVIASSMLTLAVAAFQVIAAPTITTNNLLYYTSQFEFETVYPSLLKEDFEESPIADGEGLAFPIPLDSSTNAPGAFAPGDIRDGLAIQTVNGTNPSNGLYAMGTSLAHNTSKALGIYWFSDTMDILFTGDDVNVAGMDFMLAVSAASVTISVYGPDDTLLETLTSTVQTSETFFGIYSNQPIAHITVASEGQIELVDNIQFGRHRNFPWPMFLPAITVNSVPQDKVIGDVE